MLVFKKIASLQKEMSVLESKKEKCKGRWT